MNYDGIIDGGYLSFLIGSRSFRGIWDMIRGQYRNGIICADSRSFRKEIYADYKSARATKREDPNARRIYEQVKEFRDLMMQDTTVNLCYVDGAEGDDLVAALFLEYGWPVTAVDKDLQQVPGMYAAMTAHDNSKPTYLLDKAPKYMSNLDGSPWSFVIYQALRGDKSDSVPRLLPSGVADAKAIWSYYHPRTPVKSMKAFYRIFGEDLLLNLNLILIPGPQLADDKICDERLLKLVVTGDYWQPKRWTRLIGQCAESIARREQYLDSVW